MNGRSMQALLGACALICLPACGETSGAVLERIPEHQTTDAGDSSKPPDTNLTVNVFLLESVESCAVGEPCWNDPDLRDEATCFELEFDDGFRLGFRTDTLDFVSPDDEERLQQAQQRQCFDLRLDQQTIADLKGDFSTFRSGVFDLSGKEIVLEVAYHPISSLRAELARWGNESGFFLPSKALSEHVRSLTRRTDFTFAVTGWRDPYLGIEPRLEHCAGTADELDEGLGGAGYTWLTERCATVEALVRHWMLQVGFALRDANGFDDAYDGAYPFCRESNVDPSRWWPSPDDCSVNPDSPTCEDRCQGTDRDYLEHVLTAHWPRGRTFVGNYCNNGQTDFDETSPGVGGVCDDLGN